MVLQFMVGDIFNLDAHAAALLPATQFMSNKLRSTTAKMTVIEIANM